MKIYRNLSEIKKKEKQGRQITLVGLIVLFVGLLFSFIPTWFPSTDAFEDAVIRFVQFNWVYISFGALALGFVAANIGSYYINRFAPRRWPDNKTFARPDELVERLLKGFDNKYSLFLWSLPQSSYLLVGPCGVLNFIVRSDKGRVVVNGDRWREPFGLGRIFTAFTREGLGNPGRELQEIEGELRKALQNGSTASSEEGNLGDVPIAGAVLFLNSAIQLEVESPSVPVLRADQVKDFVRRQTRETKLSAAQVRAVTERLAGLSTVDAIDAGVSG